MCGIFCSLSGCGESKYGADVLETCLHNLRNRGPDSFQSVTFEALTGHKILLAASVLQTQGKKLCQQPFICPEGVLCWNGDIFGGPLVDDIHADELCDTEVLAKLLSEAIVHKSSPAEILSQITGPYSFIFYIKQTGTIWFGRDPAGRHSLLYGFSESPSNFTLSSVSHSSLAHMKELPAVGLFEIDLNLIENLNELAISLHPWRELDSEKFEECCGDLFLKIKIQPPVSQQQYIFRPLKSSTSEEDTAVIHSILKCPQEASVETKMEYISNLPSFHKNMIRLLSLLNDSVRVRVETNVSFCQNCITLGRPDNNICSHSKVAILFSGGLDSAILARIADKYVPQDEPIDLLNVAFEKKKVCPPPKKGASKNNCKCDEPSSNEVYNVPDRQSGKRTLSELQSLCPQRIWNFVEINITAAELQEERMNCITHLIHPLKTVLDDSLGCALWFAARGHGKLSDTNEDYRSPARLIVTGMGADEQFGGYRRHRSTFSNHGWVALHDQLQMELERIPSRNLGRDDRVISHHGRQPRIPFLDEEVIRFVKTLPPWERCHPSDQFPSGIGDKLLLRLVAWHIGLRGAAVLPKRAMQFGSRIANSKENAADTSERL